MLKNEDELRLTKKPFNSIIDALSEDKLVILRDRFKKKKRENIEVQNYLDAGLTEEEFVQEIKTTFGNDCIDDAMKLFNTVNMQEKGLLKWNEFLDFIKTVLEPTYEKLLNLEKFEIFSPPHVKRDSIAKFVLLETETYFCYAIITRYGKVGLFDGNMDFLTTYTVIMAREDVNKSDNDRRKRNRWITDATFISDIMMLVITNSARNMTIYDASGLKHVPIWLILGFPDIIQSIAHSICNKGKRKLALGCDSGKVSLMTFHKDKDRMFRKKYNDKLTIFYYRELHGEKEYVTTHNLGRIHSEPVNEVQFYLGKIVISISNDPRRSVYLIELGNKHQHVFKMRKGANCVAISEMHKILITGSNDGKVRVWNILVPNKPMSVISVSESDIVDIAIIHCVNSFITLSKDGSINLWDLIEHVQLQTIQIYFPSFDIKGKIIDWGTKSIFPGPKRWLLEDSTMEKDKWERTHIFITCCNYCAKINLKYLDDKSRNFDQAVLPPPPLQNSFLIPKDWNQNGDDYSESKAAETTPSEEPANLDHLSFILEKNLIQEGNECAINFKIAQLEEKKLKMKFAVEKGAPYLALDLFETEEMILKDDLPIPNLRKVKNLVEKTRGLLTDAATRSIIFSEQSSSSKSPRSTRSSIVDFD